MVLDGLFISKEDLERLRLQENIIRSFDGQDYVISKKTDSLDIRHGKNFQLGEYVIIKKPELIEVGDNVRISDFCRISAACKIGDHCELAPGTYIAGGSGKYTFTMKGYSSLAAGVKIWLATNDYVDELVTHSVPEVKEVTGDVTMDLYTGIGSNTVVMPGNIIPIGVTIGANSFVPSGFEFEPWTVYAGNPIRRKKSRNKARIIQTLEKIGIDCSGL